MIVNATISSVKDYHIITITDNDVWFDTGKVNLSHGDNIGISNVREMIEKICGGSLDIKSIIGEGTAVTLSIPCADKVYQTE